jgi:hypothetical protein
MASRKMHQTTVRFGPDLWEEIELEAQRAGVSVAQYVRDSALMRVAYTRGREGDAHYDAALGAVTGVDPSDPRRQRLDDAAKRTRANVEGATALVSQTHQAVRHTQQLRDDARRDRERRSSGSRS